LAILTAARRAARQGFRFNATDEAVAFEVRDGGGAGGIVSIREMAPALPQALPGSLTQPHNDQEK
jgi:hypothetical protein